MDIPIRDISIIGITPGWRHAYNKDIRMTGLHASTDRQYWRALPLGHPNGVVLTDGMPTYLTNKPNYVNIQWRCCAVCAWIGTV